MKTMAYTFSWSEILLNLDQFYYTVLLFISRQIENYLPDFLRFDFLSGEIATTFSLRLQITKQILLSLLESK